MSKQNLGQFYTTNADYILENIPINVNGAEIIIEPFAGNGDLLTWIDKQDMQIPVRAYDLDPKKENIVKQDTLKNPPNYDNTYVITNPPYLARNKNGDKELYDMYKTNDLYKCFIYSVIKSKCLGGIFIIPAGFFFSNRILDVNLRNEFMSKFKITMVKYFEESVFDDTSTTVVAFSFERSPTELNEQNVEWVFIPKKERQVFTMSRNYNWIVGGDIYRLDLPNHIVIRRHVEGQPLKKDEQQTFMTLSALDSGTRDGRISLNYKPNYIYPAKDCSRTYATIRIMGKHLTEEEQMILCNRFNDFIEKKRAEYRSLFLPQFRESKEYARKRIPFELAYEIIAHLLI